MFGAPPPPSPEELKAQEDQARMTVYGALTTCVLLYLSPFAAEYVSKFV